MLKLMSKKLFTILRSKILFIQTSVNIYIYFNFRSCISENPFYDMLNARRKKAAHVK